MSFLLSTRRYFSDDLWAENIISFADAHGCLPSEFPNPRYAFEAVFGRLHFGHPFVGEVDLYGYRNALADLEEEFLNLRPNIYTRFPFFHRIRRIPRLQRFASIVESPTLAISSPVQVVGQQQPLAIMPPQEAGGASQVGASQVQGASVQQSSMSVQQTQQRSTWTQQSGTTQGSSHHSTRAPSGIASTYVSQFPVSGRNQSSASTRQSTTTNIAQPTVVKPTVRSSSSHHPTATTVKPTVRGSSSHHSTATTVKPTVRASSRHHPTATTVKPTVRFASTHQSKSSSTARPSHSQSKSSPGHTAYRSSSGQSQSKSSSGHTQSRSSSSRSQFQSNMASHRGFSTLATAVNDDRFPPEHIPLDGLSKIPNPKYNKPDHSNPDHWYYCTIVRNNTASGMGTKRSEAQEKAKKQMIAMGLKDDNAKKTAVNQAIDLHKTLQFVSDGPRGKLYLLKPGFEHILGAAISMGAQDGRRWTLLGIGEKSIKDHYLLLALKM